MKKSDLIKLALIGLTSSVCLAAKDSDELGQTLSMYRRNCRGHRCKGNNGKCKSQKRDSSGYYGAKTKDGYSSNSDKYSCSGPGGCNGMSDEEMNESNSCSGKSGCSGKKDKNSCRGNGKCSSKSSKGKCPSGKCQKNADRNAKKRYDSSF